MLKVQGDYYNNCGNYFGKTQLLALFYTSF